MKKLKLTKNTVIVICIIVILGAAFGVILCITLKNNGENRDSYNEKLIEIFVSGESRGKFTFDELITLAGRKEFSATYKPSGKEPIQRTYGGVYLKDVFDALEIDLTSKQGVIFTAADTLQKLYSVSDILEEDNVYIADTVNGQAFNKGILPSAYNDAREDGGAFVVIKAKDKVSQNRVKMLVKIEVY